VFKQKPAIEDRRLGQFLTGDSVKNSPALTKIKHSFVLSDVLTCIEHGIINNITYAQLYLFESVKR